MYKKKLKYNPPENYPGHNTNLNTDNLVPYKVVIKYTTSFTGEKEFYLTPKNLNITQLTPSTQELSLGDEITLLIAKLPAELLTFISSVTGDKYDSIAKYVKLIKKYLDSESTTSANSFSHNELKMKAHIQSNPYFEYHQLSGLVVNKQDSKTDVTKKIYAIKTDKGIYNVSGKQDDKTMTFTLIETHIESEEIKPAMPDPEYHKNKQVVLINLNSEFKASVEEMNLPSGKEQINYLTVYGPTAYPVDYNPIEHQDEGKSEDNDIEKHWHVAKIVQRYRPKLVGARGYADYYKFRKVSVPSYPKFTYWEDKQENKQENKQKKLVENFKYRIKETIDNLVYLPSYNKNNKGYYKNNTDMSKMSWDGDKQLMSGLLKEKKKRTNRIGKTRIIIRTG